MAHNGRASASINWEQKTISFIGAGELVQSLLTGIVHKEILPPQQIRVTNKANEQRLQHLADTLGVTVSYDKARMIRDADLVVVAVKPADAPAALAEIRDHLDPDTLLVSVMAGIPLDFLFEQTSGHERLVRAMPNTAGRVGQAATALCAHAACDADSFRHATDLFGRIGTTVNVTEDMFDAVTAVSGSGPAYVYLLLEGMLDAARELGLPDDVARNLAVQTLIGAGAMLSVTGLPPHLLREQVTSPAGTTAAALQVLNDGGFLTMVRQAVQRAAERAAELSDR